MNLEQHIKRVEEVLTFHLLFPTAGPIKRDRDALASLLVIAEHCGVKMEPLPGEPASNAERMREAARTYNERKRPR